MIRKLYYTIGLFAVLFAAGCSESLKETYDEFAGDGMIRYLGKCANVEVNPGWERLQVVWKHNIDAGVKKVKITWNSDQGSGEMFVDPCDPDSDDLMDTVYIEKLADAMYTVRVNNVADDGRESLVEEKYGRPYSYDHEDLRSFSRGVTAFSRMGDKLVVLLDQSNENIKEMLLCFKDKTGREHQWDMKEHADDSLSYKYYGQYDIPLGRDYIFLLPDEEGVEIDFNQPITVQRKGKLLGCVDEIDFKDETLNLNERLWSTAFTQLMLGLYGPNWENRVSEVETLEMDFDMVSMQDLMYFPNLKKVILGKNRYMDASYAKTYHSTTDEYVGLVMLQFLKDTRSDFTVERYNGHYFYQRDAFGTSFVEAYKNAGKLTDLVLEEKGDNNLSAKPAFVPLDTTGWEMTCSDTVYNGYKDNGVANLLFDGPRHFVDEYWGDEYDAEVYFEPAETVGASVVTVTFDMKTPRVVEGFKVGQPTRNQKGDTDYLLSNLKISFSVDGYTWTDSNYTDGSASIGNTPGEETYLLVPEEMRTPVRYIRLTMANRPIGTISSLTKYCLRLGKFIPCTVE
jgi:lipoprotein